MMADRLSSYVTWGIALVLVAVPLVFWHGVFFPHTFIKTIVFYVLMELLFAMWIVLAVARQEYRPRFSAVMGAFLLFLVCMGIASYSGINDSKSVWSEYERMMGFITWLHAGAFFLVLSSVVQKDAQWRMIWRAVIGTAVAVAGFAVWQGFTTSDLSISTIGNAAYLSSYLVPIFFLACMYLLREEQFTKRVWLYVGFLLLFLLAIAFTQARAGVVGLLVGGGIGVLLFICFGNPQERTLGLPNNTLKKYMGAVALCILMVFGMVVFLFSADGYQLPGPFAGLLDFSLENRTTAGRFLVWSIAWEGWKERFLFGWGPEQFSILFNAYYKPELYAVEPWFDRAHNFIFDYGSTMGIAGLIAYVSMFGAACYMAIDKWRRRVMPFWYMVMVCSIIGAHLAQNLFTFDTISSLLVVLVVLGFTSSREGIQHDTRAAGRGVFVAGVVAVLVMGTAGYVTAARPFLANASAHRGWELLRTGGGDEAAIAEFEKSISYDTHYSVDARRFVAEYVFEFLKQDGKRPDESLARLMRYAIEQMTESMATEPENVKWVMYRGELHSLFAQKFDVSFAKKAEEDFTRARDMSPGRPQIYLELAQARKMQGDTAKAWEYIDYAIRMAPNFYFGHLNALVLAIETGNTFRETEEYTWLENTDATGTLRDEAIRDAYVKARRYQDAVIIQENVVHFIDKEYASSPSYRAIFYAHLAALYQYAGDIERARMTAYKVLELDPKKKDEVEAFLSILP